MKILQSSSKLHWIKNLYLRWRYGAGCCDIYNAESFLSKKIVPVLREFRAHTCSWPIDLEDFGQWLTILDEMIWAFEHEEVWEEPFDREKEIKILNRQQFGFELFGIFFRDLFI